MLQNYLHQIEYIITKLALPFLNSLLHAGALSPPMALVFKQTSKKTCINDVLWCIV